MALLHMEVESVEAAQARIVTGTETLLNSLTAVTSQLNQTVNSAWIGNSANEFLQSYDTLRSQISQQLDNMAELAKMLKLEIAQWQEMASRLG